MLLSPKSAKTRTEREKSLVNGIAAMSPIRVWVEKIISSGSMLKSTFIWGGGKKSSTKLSDATLNTQNKCTIYACSSFGEETFYYLGIVTFIFEILFGDVTT